MALRTTAKDPGLLAGLLYDSRGNAMSPTHTRKGNRRYRYYVSQAMLQYREAVAGEVTRVPAPAVEGVILKRLKEFLTTPTELLDLLSQDTLSAPQRQGLIREGQILADEWSHLEPPEQIPRLQQIIRGFSVMRQCIDITLSRTGLWAMLTGNQKKTPTPFEVEKDEYRVRVPVRLKHCGIEIRFIVPTGDTAPAHPASTRAVLEALAKALEWNEALMSGEVSSMNTLAKREGVTQRYIAHLIKLAWLAPDIMEAITRGDVPSTVSLGRLKKGFPLDWDQQRKILGFTA